MRAVEVAGFPSYEVTDDGRVRRKDTGRWLKLCVLIRGGYLQVNLYKNGRPTNKRVNVLVCEAFHGPRPSPLHHAAHSDGDKHNNRADNLSWKTPKENELDKIAHGSTNRGERNGQAKVTDRQAKEIAWLCEVATQAEVGVLFGLSQSGVCRARKRALA